MEPKTIINMDSSNMDQETFGVYGVDVEDKEVNLLIEVSQAGVIISDGVRENTTVSVRISSSSRTIGARARLAAFPRFLRRPTPRHRLGVASAGGVRGPLPRRARRVARRARTRWATRAHATRTGITAPRPRQPMVAVEEAAADIRRP